MTERRTFIQALMGSAAVFGLQAREARSAAPPSDVALLNVALELEHTAIYAYGLAGGSGLLSAPVRAVGGRFRESHERHREALAGALKELGGFPIAPRPSYDLSAFELRTERDLLRVALFLEMKAAHTYQSSLARFRHRRLLDAAGRILGDEVNHAAVLRAALGKDPVGSYGQLDEGLD